MLPRDEKNRIQDIRDAITKIRKYTQGLSSADFIADEKTVDAVVRNFAIIGEVAAKLPEAIKRQHPSIPWPKLVGLRNLLVHEYFRISPSVLWETNESRKILADVKGELKDHFVTATKEELNDPNINICAGIRWLFHKRSLLSKSKKPSTWIETIWEFKGARSKRASKKKNAEIQKAFAKLYEKYQKCESK